MGDGSSLGWFEEVDGRTWFSLFEEIDRFPFSASPVSSIASPLMSLVLDVIAGAEAFSPTELDQISCEDASSLTDMHARDMQWVSSHPWLYLYYSSRLFVALSLYSFVVLVVRTRYQVTRARRIVDRDRPWKQFARQKRRPLETRQLVWSSRGRRREISKKKVRE